MLKRLSDGQELACSDIVSNTFCHVSIFSKKKLHESLPSPTQGRGRPEGFLPQLDEFLFYNSWKENCGKLQMHSSEFLE
jgi:hypothetical protein